MGEKGAKMSNEAEFTVELLKEKLSVIDGIAAKKMFGGYGVFHEGKMFALVNSQGEPFFKSDESISAKFVKAGSHQHGRMPYFSVPEDIFNDIEQLTLWAKESIEISK